MPFKFTGTLEKVQIKLGPNELAPQQRGELEQLKERFRPGGSVAEPGMEDVRLWHKADTLNALANVRFGRKADMDQPLLTKLDL
jgi:hypothetical protein